MLNMICLLNILEYYVAHCVANGFFDPETGEQSDFSFYTTFMNRSFAYDEIAEGVMNKTGVVIASEFYQVVTTLASSGIAKLDELSQKEMYEAFIMDYLQYEYSSSEYESQFDENVLKYSKKIYKELVDYEISLGNDKSYLKQLSFDDKIMVLKESLFLDNYIKPYMKAMGEIDKISSTLEDFQNNVATIMAIAEANEGRIAFLKSVRSQAVGNDSLCAAIDEVINKIENSADAISAETIEQGIDITLDWAWGEISGILKKKFPELEAIDTATDVLDAVLNTSNQSSNVIRIILLYTFEQYAIQATRISYVNYARDKSEESASEFNRYFSAYLAYQAYASNWSKKFASAGLLDGFLNNLKNCFSDTNKEAYAYWEKKINIDISQCETAQNYINNCRSRYFDLLNDDSENIQFEIESAKNNIDFTITTYNGHTYQLFNKTMNWIDAEKYCEGVGGHLATITTDAEQNTIQNLISLNNTCDYYWLGANDAEHEGDWIWVTGEEFKYTNFGIGAPNNGRHSGYEETENYLGICGKAFNWDTNDRSDIFQWNDFLNFTSDSYRNYNTGFICEWDSIASDIIPPDRITASYDGHSYKIIYSDMTEEEMRIKAENVGGHLVTIDSDSEQTIINILKENAENNYYIIEWDNPYMSLEGDVNLDGKVGVSDAVLLQKWLLALPNTHLPCWEAGDLCENEKLDVFDLCLLKRKLING